MQQPEHHKPTKKKKHLNLKSLLKRWWWLVILISIVVLALVAAGFLAFKYLDARSQLTKTPNGNGQTNTNNTAKVDTEAILAEISKYLELPKGKPAVATINDVNQVKGQDFFKNAQNGDIVFIFSEAKRGLLWRPSTHKIIEYTKVDVSPGSQSGQ